MTDRDALIEQMRGKLELVMADTEHPGRHCLVSPAELDALISLASPSPAQTETECAENAHSPAQWPEDVVERAAQNIFEHWAFNPDQVPWVPRGNSDKQDTARRLAYAAISKLRPPPPERVKGLVARIGKINELYFRPWGAAKSVEWEELSDDRPFNSDTAMAMIDEALASYRGGA